MDRGTLYFIVFAIVVVSCIVTFIVYISRPPQYDYFAIEGKILDVKTGERLTLIWENDDGTFVLTFGSTSKALPIGKEITLTYYFMPHSSFPWIENVEVC